jgi:hypothetical protein
MISFKSLTAVLLFGGYFNASQAQESIKILNRLEIEDVSGTAKERTYLLKQQGMLIQTRSNKAVDGFFNWKYDHYNSDLKLNKSYETEIAQAQKYNFTGEDQNGIYNFNCDAKNNGVLHYFNKENGEFQQKEIQLNPASKKLEGLYPTKGAIHFVGNVKKTPLLFTVNLTTFEVTETPLTFGGLQPKSLKIKEVISIPNTNEIAIVYVTYNSRKSSNVFINIIDSDQKEKFNGEISGKLELETNLNSQAITKLSEGKYALTGTYSGRSTITTEGIYFGILENGDWSYFNQYKYTDFEHFFDYLSEKQQEKLGKKLAKAESRGKELNVNVLMESHEIIPVGNKFLYVGESYYPTYRTEVTYVNGKATTQRVFDGYQYTHASIVSFDETGKKEWDQIFELNPGYKPYSPIEFLTIRNNDASSIGLVYASGKKIYAQTLNINGEITNQQTINNDVTLNSEDEVRRSTGTTDYWYDNYFLNSGYQVIKNTDDKSKRKVNYYNKVEF